MTTILTLESRIDLIIKTLSQEGLNTPELDLLLEDLLHKQPDPLTADFEAGATRLPNSQHFPHLMQLMSCRRGSNEGVYSTPVPLLYWRDRSEDWYCSYYRDDINIETGQWYHFRSTSQWVRDLELVDLNNDCKTT